MGYNVYLNLAAGGQKMIIQPAEKKDPVNAPAQVAFDVKPYQPRTSGDRDSDAAVPATFATSLKRKRDEHNDEEYKAPGATESTTTAANASNMQVAFYVTDTVMKDIVNFEKNVVLPVLLNNWKSWFQQDKKLSPMSPDEIRRKFNGFARNLDEDAAGRPRLVSKVWLTGEPKKVTRLLSSNGTPIPTSQITQHLKQDVFVLPQCEYSNIWISGKGDIYVRTKLEQAQLITDVDDDVSASSSSSSST
jgi:hypothetical protein